MQFLHGDDSWPRYDWWDSGSVKLSIYCRYRHCVAGRGWWYSYCQLSPLPEPDISYCRWCYPSGIVRQWSCCWSGFQQSTNRLSCLSRYYSDLGWWVWSSSSEIPWWYHIHNRQLYHLQGTFWWGWCCAVVSRLEYVSIAAVTTNPNMVK